MDETRRVREPVPCDWRSGWALHPLALLDLGQQRIRLPPRNGGRAPIAGTRSAPSRSPSLPYRIRSSCDGDWMPQSCTVNVALPREVRTIELRSDHVGGWEVNGNPAPHLTSCSDIDLGGTPATNTVPIRRLDLEIGIQPALSPHGFGSLNSM